MPRANGHRLATRETQSSNRRSRPREPSEESINQSETGGGEAAERDRGEVVTEETDAVRSGHALARLALFAESKRATLKRDEISKKILGSNRRGFASTRDDANQLLKDIFGMELAEMSSRAQREAQEKLDGEDGDDGAAAGKTKLSAAPKSYILRTTLDTALIEAANSFDQDIHNEERNDLVEDGDEEYQDLHSGGCIIAWQKSDRVASLGLLTVILSLILVNGRELSDTQLRGYLKTLGLPSTKHIPFKTALVESAKSSVTIDSYLSLMVKQGYLDKIKVNAALPAATQQPANKRGRQSKAGDADPDAQYLWKWGSRAMTEFGETAAVEFVASLMLDRPAAEEDSDSEEDSEEDGEEVRERPVNGKHKRRELQANDAETMRKSIIKAAGMLTKV